MSWTDNRHVLSCHQSTFCQRNLQVKFMSWWREPSIIATWWKLELTAYVTWQQEKSSFRGKHIFKFEQKYFCIFKTKVLLNWMWKLPSETNNNTNIYTHKNRWAEWLTADQVTCLWNLTDKTSDCTFSAPSFRASVRGKKNSPLS